MGEHEVCVIIYDPTLGYEVGLNEECGNVTVRGVLELVLAGCISAEKFYQDNYSRWESPIQ